MGGIISKPSRPDTSAMESRIARERAERQRLEDRNEARTRNLRRRGVRNPLLFETYLGVAGAAKELARDAPTVDKLGE